MPTEHDGLLGGYRTVPKARAALPDVVASFWPLGLVAFGGPQAHVALLHTHFVERRGWLTDETFVELLALGHALPGPTSTQMVVAVASARGGVGGAVVAFALWGLPAMATLIAAGIFSATALAAAGPAGPWFARGLAPAAVALVYGAAAKITTKCVVDRATGVITAASAVAVVLATGDPRVSELATQLLFPGILLAGGACTALCGGGSGGAAASAKRSAGLDVRVSEAGGAALIAAWALTFAAATFLRSRCEAAAAEAEAGGVCASTHLVLFETFFRVGSTVFGGGQVVLPMLFSQMVTPGLVTEGEFFSGMALTQSLPGPLFNFSAFLGSVTAGLTGALVSVLGLFGPGFLLILGVSPFWLRVRNKAGFRAALRGVNAAAAGMVVAAAALLTLKAVTSAADAAVVVVSAGMARAALFGDGTAPASVLMGAGCGALLAYLGVAQGEYA